MEEDNSRSGGAGAILSLKPNSSIGLAYHQDFGLHNELILLEIDEKILPDILSQRVTIRGQQDEDAVLCTNSKTYSMKFVGTSNSAFLIPPSGQLLSQQYLMDSEENHKETNSMAYAIKLAPGTMELAEIAPRLDKLRSLISKKPFEPFELSAMEVSQDGLYTWDDLTEQIQASDKELRFGLKSLAAVEINGNWRILDDKYMETILSMILQNAIINDWSLNSLDENEVVGVLKDDGFSSNLVVHCLDVHGKLVNGGVSGVSTVWELDERRVCVLFARGILKGRKMKLESFMDEWTRKVPRGMQASIEMLEGEILTERLGIEMLVRGFSVSSLPFLPAERFAALFRERPRWEGKDLEPYIRDLKVPGLSAEGLLLKFTRRSQPTADSEPVFSAR